MKSLAFPKIFNNVRTRTITDHDATVNNLELLLLTEKGDLFGDPYFGTTLKKSIYEQGSVLLKDIVVDAIYTAIIDFMPQLQLSRNDITITIKNGELYATIKAVNLIDYTTNLYELKLMDS